jgi:hypothetical protein
LHGSLRLRYDFFMNYSGAFSPVSWR